MFLLTYAIFAISICNDMQCHNLFSISGSTFVLFSKFSSFSLIIWQQTWKSEDMTNMGILLLPNTLFKVGLTHFRRSFWRYIDYRYCYLKKKSIKIGYILLDDESFDSLCTRNPPPPPLVNSPPLNSPRSNYP